MELAMHAPALAGQGMQHYGVWLLEQHPEQARGFARPLAGIAGGETGAPEAAINPIPRDLYHTDWIADRTIGFLDSLAADDDWFVWMSFPDPHHPWDPPAAERKRVPWQDLDLPPGHGGSRDAIREVLAQKPAHWLAWYEGTWVNIEGGPAAFQPATLTDDQLREVNALTHVMNELIDEACGRVLARVTERGWAADTDVFFTTDHGELQGDFGLLFKGPFHVDALMRVPLVWRPAPSAGVEPAEVREPVGHLDLAPTFCAIAGVETPEWMQGEPLPVASGSGRERVLCEWDSQFPGYGMHMRSIYRDGYLCTAYEPSTKNRPNGLEGYLATLPPTVVDRLGLAGPLGPESSVEYDGTEGELYDVEADPHQLRNLWDDPGYRVLRSDLVADLYDHLPASREQALAVERPA
jgi:arylsulfatase A-like enzyme